MNLKCLNLVFSYLLQGLRLFRRLAILLVVMALPAYATITAGTINFGTGHASWQDVSTNYNGVTFTGQWVYYTAADLLSGTGIISDGDTITDASMTGGVIKSGNGPIAST